MNHDNAISCPDCGAMDTDGCIFHKEFCCDAYILSAPSPQSEKQKSVDCFMAKHVTIPLEERGYKCYQGSRNIIAGQYIIDAMSHPMSYTPLILVPLFKDTQFSALCQLALRAEHVNRTVFLAFDSTTVYFPGVSPISVNDPFLLKKIIEAIKQNSEKFPLEERRRKYEMGIETDSDSTVSSLSSYLHKPIPFRRSDKLRMSFRAKHPEISTRPEGIILLEDIKRLTSPQHLLKHCLHGDDKISKFAAKVLTRIIKKDIRKFSKTSDLQSFERNIRQKIIIEYTKNNEMDNDFEKLYFWILASAYLKIFGSKDASLKCHIKHLELQTNKSTKNHFNHLCQKTYHKLSASIVEKIRSWPNSLYHNQKYIKTLETCFTLLEHKVSDEENLTKMLRTLTNLPRDIQHIFVTIITEKIFENKFQDSYKNFFKQMFTIAGKKHVEIFLPVVERTTEYILQNVTNGTLEKALQLLQIFLELVNTRSKNDKLMIIADHYFKKLVYHTSMEVRKFVTSFVFRDYLGGKKVVNLGESCITVSDELVEECIREKLSNSYPDLIVGEQVNRGPNALVFVAQSPCNAEALLYIQKQDSLNDILQTNLSDNAYESFQDMSRAVTICQGHDNIIKLQNIPFSSSLPFYVVEYGVPLLEFLHEKENQLTLLQMTELLLDMTKAVAHSHNIYVILRDITPASFVTVARINGSFQVKLANWQCAKCTLTEEVESHAQEYIEDINLLCFQGDANEPVPAYFSAPETLTNRTFSKYTESWMLAVTFYSALMYGRQPFEELAHLTVYDFVKEITSRHTAEMPGSFVLDLWTIVSCNLEFEPSKRKSINQLLEELNAYKDNLGARGEAIYSVKAIGSFINPEDIQKGYFEKEDNFKLEVKEISHPKVYCDEEKKRDCLYQTVSSRLNLNIRKKLNALNHPNILGITDIINGPYTTTLVSCPFEGYTETLAELPANTEISDLLLYLWQLSLALQQLHSKNIVHCDLRGIHVYLDPDKRAIKLGHLGRAVFVKGKPIFKMMPIDAEQWSAPEVKTNGVYSVSSDVFALAMVFWEAISTQKAIMRRYRIKPFKKHSRDMKPNSTVANISRDGGDCINEILKCMHKCWNHNPTKRPSVDEIVRDLTELCHNVDTFRMQSENVDEGTGYKYGAGETDDTYGAEETDDTYGAEETDDTYGAEGTDVTYGAEGMDDIYHDAISLRVYGVVENHYKYMVPKNISCVLEEVDEDIYEVYDRIIT